jgi:hypothetical protein
VHVYGTQFGAEQEHCINYETVYHKMKLGKAYERGSWLQNVHFSALKVLFGISYTASVFTQNAW